MGTTMNKINTEKYVVRKLNQDDILEIVCEHYIASARSTIGMILGTPGVDLRFIGVWGPDVDDKVIDSIDLEELDKEVDFNGDHSFLEKNPNFYIRNYAKLS
jgi:hypothetical protein